MGSITAPKATLGVKPAPTMASFSSRGPNLITPAILKPDITAPGVNIIAAYTEGNSPSNEVFDNRRTAFNVMSGTSMSCPHVSGVVGLLKAIHPDWSPSAIRSALMTTVPALSGDLIVTRTLTNVGSPGTYTARVGQPPGISVVVEPNVLIFKSQGQTERFSLHIKAVNTTYFAGVDQHKYGELVWSDGTHTVRSPITVEIAH
ncbi:hypothetical protein RND71_035054 [Anisodus tanguticus]|uniref:Subtilisin-like protease fibronectin type-III domain-containing protein n=1 Tax=Anisodus tanguticus TaxID=243964 RepID=A0AAE1R4E2_9SOLA|nr:hypothetical protein RND71_035054 [Anisodus tanguticus]